MNRMSPLAVLLILPTLSFAQSSNPAEVTDEGHLKTRLTSFTTSNSVTITFEQNMGFSPQLTYAESGRTEFAVGYTSQRSSDSEEEATGNSVSSLKSETNSTVAALQAATLYKFGSLFLGLNASAFDWNLKFKNRYVFGADNFASDTKLNIGVKAGTAALGYSLGPVTVTGTHYYSTLRVDVERASNHQEYALAYQLPRFEIGVNHSRTLESDNISLAGSSALYTRWLVQDGTQLGLCVRKHYMENLKDNYETSAGTRTVPFELDYYEYLLAMEQKAGSWDLEISLRTRQQSYVGASSQGPDNIRSHSISLAAYKDFGAGAEWGAGAYFKKADHSDAEKTIDLQQFSVNVSMGKNF